MPNERLTELSPTERARAEAVLLEHGRFIEAVATRYAPTYDAVPDIVQEVGIRVCQSLHTFRAEANIRTWLFRIAHNEAVTAYRQRHRHDRTAEVLGQQPEPTVDIERDVIDSDLDAQRRALVRDALSGIRVRRADGSDLLTPRQREALRHVTERKNVLLVAGDKSALSRARQRMRQWVRDHHDELAERDE